MKFTKKAVSAAVCIVLIISAVLLSSGTGNLAGAGMGQNAEVKTIVEAKDLFDYASSPNKSSSALKSSADNTATESKQSENKYTSYTMTETTDMTVESRSSSENKSTSGRYLDSSSTTAIVMKRTLTVYRTDDAILYKSEGRLTSSSTSSNPYTYYEKPSGGTYNDSYESIAYRNSTTQTSLNFKVQVYVNSTKKTVLLFFEQFHYTYLYSYTDSKNSDKNKTETEKDKDLGTLTNYIGQWIDCSSTPSIASVFLNANNDNLVTLAELGALIKKSDEGDEKLFDKRDGVYVLKTKPLKELLKIPNIPEDKFSVTGSLEINLNNRSTPIVNCDFTFNAYNSESGNGISYSASATACVRDNIVFKNINNTVVSDADIDAIDIEDLIEREKENSK